MAIATSYAKALHQLVSKEPQRGREYLSNLEKSLESRGYQKLLPNILKEYEKLDIQKARSASHAEVTPEKEQVRILLSLYKKLTESH